MTTPEKCPECGGHKKAVNKETGEQICDNRSCSKSPMNNYLTHKDTHIGKEEDTQ